MKTTNPPDSNISGPLSDSPGARKANFGDLGADEKELIPAVFSLRNPAALAKDWGLDVNSEVIQRQLEMFEDRIRDYTVQAIVAGEPEKIQKIAEILTAIQNTLGLGAPVGAKKNSRTSRPEYDSSFKGAPKASLGKRMRAAAYIIHLHGECGLPLPTKQDLKKLVVKELGCADISVTAWSKLLRDLGWADKLPNASSAPKGPVKVRR